MGRHSSPEQWPFYRSVAVWLAPWVLVTAVLVAALWIGLTAMMGEGAGAPHGRGAAAKAVPTQRATQRSTPSPQPSPTPTRERRQGHATPSPRPTHERGHQGGSLITKGITVQVLNGTGVTNLAQTWADRLTRLGFTVVAVQTGLAEPHTTVYWATPKGKPAAKALAAHFGWRAAPAPPSLSSSVDVHVDIGADEASSG